ncbi:nucleotidyltransferase family protein [Ornithinimicrobium sp. Y1847]|uniref:nucleotidyltransferase family protein n=1 Tax=unclassified Ornithinimicrobium TaxID=2615080 RepID=UPI003B68422C
MSTVTEQSAAVRALLVERRAQVDEVLRRYHATHPRLFGSVARGSATPHSDIDLLVDLDPDHGNALLRIAGIAEELSEILGTRVDVVAEPLLRPRVSHTALRDAVLL